MPKKSITDALKTTSETSIQKKSETNGNLVGNKVYNKITKVRKVHYRILQRQWEVKRKYQKKDIYLQKKDRKILMNSD